MGTHRKSGANPHTKKWQDTSNAGIIPCLKCDEDFHSRDKKRIRICDKCKAWSVKGLPAIYEGF